MMGVRDFIELGNYKTLLLLVEEMGERLLRRSLHRNVPDVKNENQKCYNTCG